MEATLAGAHVETRRVGFLARRSVRHRLWIGTVTSIVTFGAIVLMFPVYFMLITSLKTAGTAFILPIRWVPYLEFTPAWQNYVEAHQFMKWTVVYSNTLKVAFAAAIGDTLSALLVAYGFARFRAPFKDALFTMMLATLMIPFAVRLVPEYLGFARLGLIDTLWPLVLPAWLGSAFYVFLLRQFFSTIPMAMDEAAKIDGAGPFRILFQILAPQIRPALIVVTISSFTFNWNDFLRPLIYLNSPGNRTAAVALSFFNSMYGGTPFHLMMAASLVMLLPILALFFALQRYYIQGVVISGVKG
jgi:multiple sugar transport system permease protein